MNNAPLLGSVCLFLMTGAALADSAGPHAFDQVSMMKQSSVAGFSTAEEGYLIAAAAGDADAVKELAHFYMAHGLWVEALARIKDDATPDGRMLAAECELRIGRYRAALERLSESAPHDAIVAIALTRLGAYAEASAAFRLAAAPGLSRGLSEEFNFAAAETFAATGDADKAADALARASDGSVSGGVARDFLTGQLRAARGDKAGAASAYRRAAESAADEWSMRARLALAEMANDVSAANNLSLQWRGGAFERDLQFALGRMRLVGADFDRGFAALGQVVDRYPESQAALDAQDLIAATLPKLFADETGLHPKEAARLFFENVAFAPPGWEGDALIHKAAGMLEVLGLYRQAAQLLDHQVFKRLRGDKRATVAADLAELLLQARDPKGALKVIQSTRFAGLPGAVNERRRQIESRALAETGKAEEAITLLSEAPVASDLRLRAEINWSQRAWPEAARDYAAYFLSLGPLAGGDEKSAAVRAATAFLLAGDRAGYRAFSVEAASRLDNAAEADLIRSLGDVDHDQFLAKVMEDYRAVYGGDKS